MRGSEIDKPPRDFRGDGNVQMSGAVVLSCNGPLGSISRHEAVVVSGSVVGLCVCMTQKFADVIICS